MASAESALQAAQIDLSASKAIADELEEDVRAEKAARIAAEAAAARAAESLAASTQRIAELKALLDAAVAARGQVSGETAALVTEIATLRGELEAVSRRATESAARIADLEQALSAATATTEAMGCEFQVMQVRSRWQRCISLQIYSVASPPSFLCRLVWMKLLQLLQWRRMLRPPQRGRSLRSVGLLRLSRLSRMHSQPLWGRLLRWRPTS